jgi:hypothetical protein
MTAEARARLGELPIGVPELLARHRAVKVQIIEQERELAYAKKSADIWKHRMEMRVLYCMARILVRRIHALKREALEMTE